MAWELVDEEPQEEGWGQFALRQVAKAPATIARIPGIAGDVQEAILGVTGLGREAAKQSWPRTIARRVAAPIQLPTTEDIRNVERKILPEYVTETRPGLAENIAEFGTQALATGGLSGIASALKGGATAGQALKAGGQAIKQLSPKTLTGAFVGGHAGGATAEALGLSPEAQTLSSLAGGGLGAAAAHAVGTKKPSTRLAHKAFKEQKTTQLAEIEQSKTNLENHLKQLEQVSSKGYKKAQEIAPKIKANAIKLKDSLEKISKSLGGIEEPEQKRITAILGQIESFIEGDSISLEQAKMLKENLRATVYDKNVPTSIRNKGRFLHSELNELIKEAGSLNPEHGIPFAEAESAYTQLKDLRKQEKTILDDLNKQKQKLEKQTFKDYQKAQAGDFWENAIEEGKKFGARQTVMHALRTVLGKGYGTAATAALETVRWSAAEFNKVKKILQENPTIKAEVVQAAKLIKDQNWPAATAAIQKLNEDLAQEEKPKNEWVLLD